MPAVKIPRFDKNGKVRELLVLTELTFAGFLTVLRVCRQCVHNRGGLVRLYRQRPFVVIFDGVIAILLSLILLLPSLSFADPALDALVSKLQNRYQTLDTLKANFTQSYRSKRFSDAIVEQGTVYFKKGGLMKWEYEHPDKKVFVSDSRYYYYYVAEDKQLVKAPVSSGGQNSPTLFLAGRGDFVRDFHADWADPRPGSHVVRLTPLQNQSDFKYLIVDVDPVRGLILHLEVVDEYDNRTEYNFQEMTENPKLPDNFFSFQAPPGTDIVFQQPESE